MDKKVHEFVVKVRFDEVCSRQIAMQLSRQAITGSCQFPKMNDNPTKMTVVKIYEKNPKFTEEGIR